MGVPTPRGAVALGNETEIRLQILEGRGGVPARLSDSGSGSTAERDIYYTVPTTDAQRVGLANRVPTWFNVDKGYTEGYYATTGLPDLTARGLVAGVASGWYPQPGSLITATRIKSNGFQPVVAATITQPTLLSPALTNIGGFGMSGSSGLTPPFPGYYDIVGSVYFSGGGSMAYRNVLVMISGVTILSARITGNGPADGQAAVVGPSVPLTVSQSPYLAGQPAGADNIYGDGINRHTFLSLAYTGPLVVNG